jgi:hypothetical protein
MGRSQVYLFDNRAGFGKFRKTHGALLREPTERRFALVR